MVKKNIVVVGVGFVGVYVIKKLFKYFKKNVDVEIMLIDWYLYFMYMIELYEVVIEWVEFEYI